MQRKHNFKNGQLRLRGWNYAWEGAYFITFNTKDKQLFFGTIVNEKMALNQLGILAQELWKQLPEKFEFIELGEFIIMPNHIHGVLIIHAQSDQIVGAVGPVGSRLIATPPDNNNNISGGITGNHNPMLHQNLSRALRWYKGRCTFELRKLNPDFEWQSRFFDHIIRNSTSFDRITNYIRNNPKNWNKKRLNSKRTTFNNSTRRFNQ